MKKFLFSIIGLASGLMPLLAQPVITNQPVNFIAVSGGNAVFSVMATGVGSLTYQWQFNGTNLPKSIISTVAGNGTNGYSGDGGLAVNAKLKLPTGVALTSSGNLVVVDSRNFRVRMVDTNGVINTIAGNGSTGFSGDGVAATNASLWVPVNSAFDNYGNLFIVDDDNCRIRKVDTNGVITTVAGNGNASYSGDGGAATNASLQYPNGIGLDALGNLFIADSSNHRIRKVDTNGVISTVAGNGGGSSFFGDGGAATNAHLWYPENVSVDVSGNLLIADQGHNRVREVDTNGIITTIVGNGSITSTGDGGAATNASLNAPASLAWDAYGNLFIADAGPNQNRIRKVDSNGIIKTVAGNGSASYSGDGGEATNASLNSPSGIFVDTSDNLFIADYANNRVRKVLLDGPPILALNGVTTNKAGSYQVIVSNPSGSITSGVVNLAVILTVSPQSITISNGGSTNLAVVAYGTESFDYQWYFNTSTAVVDATKSILNLTNATSGTAGNYFCVVSNDFGSATSSIVSLIVLLPPSINTQPTNAQAVYGSSTSFSVSASGTPPFSYKWFFNTNTAVAGGTNSTFTLTNATPGIAGNYFCIISNAYGSVTSSIVSLTILFSPSVTTQPTNFVRVVNGSSASLNVSVTGDGPFGYQWFTSSGRTATAWPNVFAGSVQMVFVIDPGAGYVSTPQVHFIGGSGSGATATATVQSGSVVLINMNNHGSGYAAVPPAIQIDPPPTSNTPLPNQTNATLTLPSVTSTDATNYFVVVTNNYGSVTSSTVFLTVFLSPQNFSAQNVVTGLQMNLTGSPSFPYILQSATNLTPPISWKSIRTNYSDAGGNWQFTDTNLNGYQKFYRTVGQ